MLTAKRNTDRHCPHTSTYLCGPQGALYMDFVAAVEAWLRFGCGKGGDPHISGRIGGPVSCCTDWPREKDPELHDSYARKFLEPGWGGDVSDLEPAYVQRILQEHKRLAYLWGFAPSQKTRPVGAIRRVAMRGDPERREVNMRLARPRKGPKSTAKRRKCPWEGQTGNEKDLGRSELRIGD